MAVSDIAAPQTPVPSQMEGCYALLRRWIVTGDLKPGQRLTERDLMQRTQFGRTPVREALLRLNHDGLVATLPRSGYEVTQLTEKTINDLYDIWRLLGPLTLELAHSRVTPQMLSEIAALDQGEPLNEAPLADQLRHLSGLFEILAVATDNDHLIYINQRLWGDMYRMFTLFLTSPLGKAWLPKKGELTQLMQMKNPQEAAERVRRAIVLSHAGILEAFRARP